MASNGTSNGTNAFGHGRNNHKYDAAFTSRVVNLMSEETKPRHREILTSLISHLHDFCRDVELKQEEWIIGVDYVNAIGQAYKKNRNEAWRVCDILGVESLVDEINHRVVTDSGASPTSSAILGPFWSADSPFRENGDSVIQNMPKDGEKTYFHGKIMDVDTGAPIANAVFDMWQASTNGKYDVFDPENQTRNNLRGKFRTNADGDFYFYCLHPTEYSIDTTGPSAELLRIMHRHPMRPGHIHMMVSHDDYIGVTAQLYDRLGTYLETDTVFAVKDDLLLDFKPAAADEPQGAKFDVKFDVKLASRRYKPDSTMLMQNANKMLDQATEKGAQSRL
ncbi:intradiol ring-cleavage dioxygenase [Xylariaceae sp. FL0804]|nr:intradiol ring-cleavage dioxygenase [Xylariaceae sp. FL0804]